MKLKKILYCLLVLSLVFPSGCKKDDDVDKLIEVLGNYNGYVDACCNIDIDNDNQYEVVVNNDSKYDIYKLIDNKYQKIGDIDNCNLICKWDNGIVADIKENNLYYYKNYYIKDNKIVEGNIIMSCEKKGLKNDYKINGKTVTEDDYLTKHADVLSKPVILHTYKLNLKEVYISEYKKIVDEYINCGNELKQLSENSNTDLQNAYLQEALSNEYPDVSLEFIAGQNWENLGCFLKDINDDNMPELFVCNKGEDTGEFYDKYILWGIYSFNGGILCNYNSALGNRNAAYLLNDNEILEISSGGTGVNSYTVSKFDGISYNYSTVLNWYGDYIRNNGESISEDEANKIIDDMTSNIADVDIKDTDNFMDFENSQEPTSEETTNMDISFDKKSIDQLYEVQYVDDKYIYVADNGVENEEYRPVYKEISIAKVGGDINYRKTLYSGTCIEILGAKNGYIFFNEYSECVGIEYNASFKMLDINNNSVKTLADYAMKILIFDNDVYYMTMYCGDLGPVHLYHISLDNLRKELVTDNSLAYNKYYVDDKSIYTLECYWKNSKLEERVVKYDRNGNNKEILIDWKDDYCCLITDKYAIFQKYSEDYTAEESYYKYEYSNSKITDVDKDSFALHNIFLSYDNGCNYLYDKDYETNNIKIYREDKLIYEYYNENEPLYVNNDILYYRDESGLESVKLNK